MPRKKITKHIDDLVRTACHAKSYEDLPPLPAGTSQPERIAKEWTEKWTAGMARHFRQRFAQQLQNLRQQAGMSLHALATKAGIDHSQLVRLESAERSCTLETAVKIAAALGVSLGFLTDDAMNQN